MFHILDTHSGEIVKKCTHSCNASAWCIRYNLDAGEVRRYVVL